MKFISIVFIVLISASLFFYTKYQTNFSTDIIKPISENPAEKDILGEETNKTILDHLNPQNITKKINQEIENTTEKIANDTKETILASAQKTLTNVLEVKDDVEISISNTENVKSNLLIVDLSKDTNLKLNLKKDTKNYLQFKNLKTNQCIFIKDKMYKVEKDEVIEITINFAGNFPLKTTTCSENDQNIGELIVE